jgi:hypothetical protein
MAFKRATVSERIARLAAELQALQPSYEDDLAQPNEAETAFAQLASNRGKTPVRNGWPDFLVYDELSGGTIGVEVKQGGDPVRPSQARMFAALERAGVTVMVWDPSNPTTLQPWRRHHGRERPAREPRARLPKLGLMRPAKRRRD